MTEEAKTAKRGRTRWGRTALVAVPAIGVIGAITAAMAQGLLAASFAVSGVPITLTSQSVAGTGFAGTVTNAGSQGVAYAGFSSAQLSGLCAGVIPNVPIVGQVTFKITAGDDDPATKELAASNLLLDAKNLTGDGEFTGLDLGVASNALSKGPAEVRKGAGDFGLQANTANISDLRADALSAQIAGSFKLDNLSLSVVPGAAGC
ncbi:DUF6230 family protein [Actinokineospora globicatena]|uniref:DUF6230 family protein n=1 Tax=Actinokineospora globicatena TaxID=103729 RepID=UPI0020A55EEC|nr:DUF6230 family protein [Actinokineospora globicatena]MCP2304886.1 hypothetical protein [Actinokineospora globicatena]GLW77733.1 cholesterol esterase [Actinokineospora globicatena]GLW85598.1 cholesterol esterase [Actinokineospora globicatena]